MNTRTVEGRRRWRPYCAGVLLPRKSVLPQTPTYRPDLLLQALGILLGPLIVQLKHPRLLLVAGCLQELTNVVQATSGTTKLIFDEISA